VLLAALFALPMTPEQLEIYTKHTGRSTPPTEPLHEAWLVCGRRAGKSFILACIAIFIACFRDWRPHLGPGEIGTCMIICVDRRQARVIMRYCLGLLKSVPMLKQLIESETRESITLRNRIVIEVHTASFSRVYFYSSKISHPRDCSARAVEHYNPAVVSTAAQGALAGGTKVPDAVTEHVSIDAHNAAILRAQACTEGRLQTVLANIRLPTRLLTDGFWPPQPAPATAATRARA
jgi:hypothetical protein